jgi:nitroreductase
MSEFIPNDRVPEHDVDAIFTDRWSPRAFLPDPLPEWQIQSLFEAARWAPSCFNEQPWLFFHAATEASKARFVEVLVEKNRRWAAHAPLLLLVATHRKFREAGRENRHAMFDTGAAWLSLALQARRLGLYAHAMAGFSQEKAHQVTGTSPDDVIMIAAIAVGRKGPTSQLPDDIKQTEKPNSRRPYTEMVMAI